MTEQISKQLKSIKLFNLLLVILPACVLGYLVYKYSVNVPIWDQWHTPGFLFEKLGNGVNLSFADLLDQHNESRKVFPRLFFLGLAYLTGWNVQYEILSSLLLACLISLNLYKLSQITLRNNQTQLLLLLALTNLILFSPAQYENWLWGIQVIVFVPIFCITSCLLVIYSRSQIWTKLWGCCVLATFSTFSYANGLLCWVAFLPALIVSPSWHNLKRRALFGLTWLAAFSVNLGVYFYDYHKPDHHPSLAASLLHPLKALVYFCTFLGSPLAGGDLTIAPLIGGGLGLTFVGLCGYILWRSHQQRSSLLPALTWMIIGSYALVSGLITTAGRVGFGVEQAMASRYTTFSDCLIVAIPYLAMIAFDSFPLDKSQINVKIASSVLTPSRETDLILLTAFVTAVLTLHLLAFPRFINFMDESWRTRLQASACLQFIDFVDETCIVESSLFPDSYTLRRVVHSIQKLGFLDEQVADTPVIQPARRSKDKQYGRFNDLEQISAGQYIASGWAVLPQRERSADAVLLTYRNGEGKPTVFAVAAVRGIRQDIADRLGSTAYLKSGWSTTFSSKNLPEGKLKIQAWAFDTARRKMFQLSRTRIKVIN